MEVVKIGGPVYRIGVGGGAASSVEVRSPQYIKTPRVCRNIAVVQVILGSQVQGDNSSDRDLNAVQRGDAEMEQKMNRALRACLERSSGNPICSIHDQGAGGNGRTQRLFFRTRVCPSATTFKPLPGLCSAGNPCIPTPHKAPPPKQLCRSSTPPTPAAHPGDIDSPAGQCVTTRCSHEGCVWCVLWVKGRPLLPVVEPWSVWFSAPVSGFNAVADCHTQVMCWRSSVSRLELWSTAADSRWSAHEPKDTSVLLLRLLYLPNLSSLHVCLRPTERWPHAERAGAVGGRVSGEQCPVAPPIGQELPGEGVSAGEVPRWLCGEHHRRRQGTFFSPDACHYNRLRISISVFQHDDLIIRHRLCWWMMRRAPAIEQTEGPVLSTCSWSGFWGRCHRRSLRWNDWPPAFSRWLFLLAWRSKTPWTEFYVCPQWRPNATWPTRCVLHPRILLSIHMCRILVIPLPSLSPLPGGPICDWVSCPATMRRPSSHPIGRRGRCCTVTVRPGGSSHFHRGAAN